MNTIQVAYSDPSAPLLEIKATDQTKPGDVLFSLDVPAGTKPGEVILEIKGEGRGFRVVTI